MTPFHDLAEFMALPRVLGLSLSPDGTSLVAVVRGLSPDRKTYRTALWRVDPAGTAAPVRLTRSVAGEGRPRFLPDGSLLFTSARPAPTGDSGGPGGQCRSGDGEGEARLWLLPAGGGEAREVGEAPGGIEDFAVARDSGTVVFAAAAAREDDPIAERRKRRKTAGVTAILHEGLPVRSWDHQLGPDDRRLFVAAPPVGDGDGLGAPRELTPDPGLGLKDQPFAISPDGSTAVTGWWVPLPRGERRSELVAIDTATGERRCLAADDTADFSGPVVSPDGRSVVCVRERHATYDEPGEETLWLVPLGGGEGRELAPGLERWPYDLAWSADSRTVYFAAYDHGRAPIFAVDVATGEPRRLTGDDGCYDGPLAAPDGRHVYALRSAMDVPHTPVRVEASGGSFEPLRLFPAPELPGTLTEVSAKAEDGTEIRGWLTLPAEASADSPAPLVLWPHGGPHASWAPWTWRWNPWLMAARGYAVLLPDPALSLGYGRQMIRRGHGTWAFPAYADLMAVTDVATARDDIDAGRTAVMGGSYGGYMANWIAGRTDRFKAIVTHASLWPLEAIATSDESRYFFREFGDPATRPERWAANDPARHAARVRTPMLVIHGDRDYRVPIGNALGLWSDLVRHGVTAKFLYFPDENHWILTPGNATIWYETVFAFLAEHVLGEAWKRPELL